MPMPCSTKNGRLLSDSCATKFGSRRRHSTTSDESGSNDRRASRAVHCYDKRQAKRRARASRIKKVSRPADGSRGHVLNVMSEFRPCDLVDDAGGHAEHGGERMNEREATAEGQRHRLEQLKFARLARRSHEELGGGTTAGRLGSQAASEGGAEVLEALPQDLKCEA
jgi:hypothetical protein